MAGLDHDNISVTMLKCKGCTKHKLRKHFSNKWIEGAGSIKTSDIRDHNADQHIHVMEIENTEPRASHMLCLHFQFITELRFVDGLIIL